MSKHFTFPEDATPISDCSGLIPTWVHHLGDLNRLEAENILKAQRIYLRKTSEPKTWFQVKELKKMHQVMFKDVWEWAGYYRKSVTSIGIKPHLISRELSAFCHDVQNWLQGFTSLEFLEMAARVHHRLVFIHPFENGNGRFSRLVADRFLLGLKCPHPIWPGLNQDGKTRKRYIQTLKSADRGDYQPLIGFMKEFGA